MWFPNRSDRPVQAQKRPRSLKFWIKVEEESFYPSSENKGADQLRGYREVVGFPTRRLFSPNALIKKCNLFLFSIACF